MILVFGGHGQLGTELVVRAGEAGVPLVAAGHAEVDVADPKTIARAVAKYRPTLIVNAAAYNNVDRAESQVAQAERANALGASVAAASAKRAGLPIIHISTDYVFDGEKTTAYVETDPVGPLSAYGRTKAKGEEGVRNSHPQHLILRTSWLFGVHGTNFLKTVVRLAAERDTLGFVAAQRSTPTSTTDLAKAILIAADAVAKGTAPWGTYHVADPARPRATLWRRQSSRHRSASPTASRRSRSSPCRQTPPAARPTPRSTHRNLRRPSATHQATGRRRSSTRSTCSSPNRAGCEAGVPGVTRTRDPRFRKPVLYPAELRGLPVRRQDSHRRGNVKGRLILTLSLVLAGPALAAECPTSGTDTAVVAEAIDGATFRLSDGGEIRLAGIDVPARPLGLAAGAPWPAGDAARAGWRDSLPEKASHWRRAGDGPDRYGRAHAYVFLPDGHALAEALITEGLARARWLPGENGCFPAFLVSEKAARAAGRGLWAEAGFATQRADDPSLSKRNGLYDLVEGRVVSVGHGSRMIFLDFGHDYRRDFTVMVPPAVAEALGCGRAPGRWLRQSASAGARRHRGKQRPGDPVERSGRD